MEELTSVTEGVAIILYCLQILEYIIPIAFIIKLVINYKKQNNKNTLKNICLYIFISILLFGLLAGIGEIILKNTSYSDYFFPGYDPTGINENIRNIEYHGKSISFRSSK